MYRQRSLLYICSICYIYAAYINCSVVFFSEIVFLRDLHYWDLIIVISLHNISISEKGNHNIDKFIYLFNYLIY